MWPHSWDQLSLPLGTVLPGGGGRDEGRGAEGPCSEDVPSARWGGLTTFSKTGRFAGFMKSMKKDKQKQFEVILRCFHKNDLVF